MAFISTKPLEMKQTSENMETFKIVKVFDDGTITSVYFPSFIYEINKQTKEEPLVKDETAQEGVYKLIIKKGYNSYNATKVKFQLTDNKHAFFNVKAFTKTREGKEKILEAMNNPSNINCLGKHFTYQILLCIVPKNTNYFENEDGHIISQTIIPIKLLTK